MNRAQKAALASAGVGLVVLALKFGAYWLTGSLALYSDALESIVNVVAAGAAFIALRVASKPAEQRVGEAVADRQTHGAGRPLRPRMTSRG